MLEIKVLRQEKIRQKKRRKFIKHVEYNESIIQPIEYLIKRMFYPNILLTIIN